MAGTTIATSGTVGIKLTLANQNPVLVTSSGTIISAGAYAIDDAVGSGAVTNYGIIRTTGTTGTGVLIGGTGIVTNGFGTATTWLIEGATGLDIGGDGTVFNDGSILGTVGASISIGSGGSIANGSDTQTGRAILGVTDGIVFNGAGQHPAAVSNFGRIGASGAGGSCRTALNRSCLVLGAALRLTSQL